MKYFVQFYELLYEEDKASHNIHGLVHIAEDVKKYEPVDAFMRLDLKTTCIKCQKNFHKSDKTLQHLDKLYEKSQIFLKQKIQNKLFKGTNSISKNHSEGPLLDDENVLQFKAYKSNDSVINFNNCVCLKNVSSSNLKLYFILGHEFRRLGPVI